MREPTIIDRLFIYPYNKILEHIEYFFAKRWLDKNFGEQEYWGDFLMEHLNQPENEDI